MLCSFLPIHSLDEARPFLSILQKRDDPATEDSGAGVEITVKNILDAVKQGGLDAVMEYTRRFDAPEFSPAAFRVPPETLALAAGIISTEDAEVITAAADNIRDFHRAQKEQSWFTAKEDGTILGQRVLPVDRAGLYVPGGKGGSTPLISSLLMNAIPAKKPGCAK